MWSGSVGLTGTIGTIPKIGSSKRLGRGSSQRPRLEENMYNIIAKSRTKDAPSGKVYTVTLRKWDMPVSPYEVVYEMDDTENEYNPGTYRVYEYGTFDDARASFMEETSSILDIL